MSTDEDTKAKLIKDYLDTAEGRAALAEAMMQPIREKIAKGHPRYRQIQPIPPEHMTASDIYIPKKDSE